MTIRIRIPVIYRSVGLFTLCLMLTYCSHDIHEKRADTVKDHVEAFTIT